MISCFSRRDPVNQQFPGCTFVVVAQCLDCLRSFAAHKCFFNFFYLSFRTATSFKSKNAKNSHVFPVFQHYPLYRVSDAGCTGLDAAPPKERHLLFREKYDVLSKEASQRVSTPQYNHAASAGFLFFSQISSEAVSSN